MTFSRRLVLLGAAWLALCSALVSGAVAIGLWPELAPGTFRGIDLAAGIAFGTALLCALAWRRTK